MNVPLVELVDQLIASQRVKLLDLGRRFVPKLTSDDILQPNDFPELEFQPTFRHEEGVLDGMLTLRMAILAYIKDQAQIS